MAKPRITVIKELPTGLNQTFQDNKTGEKMTRSELNRAIHRGNYPNYHTVEKGKGSNKIEFPRSNPDKSKKNNLG
jgi:hypothetical protein